MKYFVLVMVSAFIGMIILTYVQNEKGIGENAVKALKLENDSLLLDNKILDSINGKLHDSINLKSYEILVLKSKDDNLKFKLEQLDIKIQSLNKKYEKANRHSNNFNSIEIQRYFSELR
jgi:hypothetical protein